MRTIMKTSAEDRIPPQEGCCAAGCHGEPRGHGPGHGGDQEHGRDPAARERDPRQQAGQGGGHDHGHVHAHDHAPGSACCAAPGATREADADALPSPGAGEAVLRLRIGQMDCPTEENLIRRKFAGHAGVRGMQFNLMQRVLTVVHAVPAQADIVAGIRELGMTPEVLDGGAGAPGGTAGGPGAAGTAGGADASAAASSFPGEPPARRRIALLASAGVLAALAEAAHFAGWPQWLAAAAALAAVAACGLSTYRKGWIAVRHGTLNINALMSIAVTGALLIGQWPEAAMVMVLFNLAELIEARSLERARNAVRSLLALAPQTASRRGPDGRWRDVPVGELAVDDVVRVAPGGRIAADGTLLDGASAVDQSAITGESLPVDKTAGDPVYAGTVNASGSFTYRVTAAAGDTTLARIIHAVEQAQARRAPTQRFIDRFSRIYTPAVVALAALVAVAPPLAGLLAWPEAIYRALALLIIACPCALVISTPVTVVSGLTAASRRGILVKGGAYLEAGRGLAWLALDKTGTLTRGQPVCTDFEAMDADGAGTDADRLPQAAQARRVAAALAARSDHPVSRALALHLDQQGHAGAGAADGASPAAQASASRADDVLDFAALPGRGVQGRIGGATYYLGNRRLLRELGLAGAAAGSAIDRRLDAWEREGKSVTVLADASRVLAAAAVADTLRETSRAAVAELHALGVRTLMLSGDNAHTVQAVAAQAGIDDARGELLPEDKLAAIEARMREAGPGKVGMAGDGINDAPALAAADIGFAMGAAGTGAAIETADVALMDDDLRKIATFVRISRATRRVLAQNIALALGIKAVFLALAVAGQASLWMAVFADVGASLLVVGNGLRLLRTPVSYADPASHRSAN